MKLKKYKFLLLLPLMCLMLAGCESAVHSVQKLDQWIKDNMW